MKKSSKTPQPSPLISTITIARDGTERVSYTAEATWASYTLEIDGQVHDLILWVHGPHADDLVPHVVAQALIWRPIGV